VTSLFLQPQNHGCFCAEEPSTGEGVISAHPKLYNTNLLEGKKWVLMLVIKIPDV